MSSPLLVARSPSIAACQPSQAFIADSLDIRSQAVIPTCTSPMLVTDAEDLYFTTPRASHERVQDSTSPTRSTNTQVTARTGNYYSIVQHGHVNDNGSAEGFGKLASFAVLDCEDGLAETAPSGRDKSRHESVLTTNGTHFKPLCCDEIAMETATRSSVGSMMEKDSAVEALTDHQAQGGSSRQRSRLVALHTKRKHEELERCASLRGSATRHKEAPPAVHPSSQRKQNPDPTAQRFIDDSAVGDKPHGHAHRSKNPDNVIGKQNARLGGPQTPQRHPFASDEGRQSLSAERSRNKFSFISFDRFGPRNQGSLRPSEKSASTAKSLRKSKMRTSETDSPGDMRSRTRTTKEHSQARHAKLRGQQDAISVESNVANPVSDALLGLTHKKRLTTTANASSEDENDGTAWELSTRAS